MLGVARGVMLRSDPASTGNALSDGSIGVALGLYICAHPAADAVSMLFFERQALRRAWNGIGTAG